MKGAVLYFLGNLNAAGLLLFLIAGTARADEIFIGGYAHDASTFISSHGREAGKDIQFGYATAPLGPLVAIGRPSAYALYSWNSARRTSFGALGLKWRRSLVSGRLYGDLGLGVALHDQRLSEPDWRAPGLTAGQAQALLEEARTFKPLGSRFLFQPGASFGWRLSARCAVEASWVHISNAGLARLNPGLDDFGARLVWRFGPANR